MTDRRQRAADFDNRVMALAQALYEEHLIRYGDENQGTYLCEVIAHHLGIWLPSFARDIKAACWEEAVTILNKFEHEGWDRERTIKALRQCFQAKIDYP